MTRVAVIMGGWSSERPVSLSSGKGMADAARQSGFDVVEIDVTRQLAQQLEHAKPDVVLNALVGALGLQPTLAAPATAFAASLRATPGPRVLIERLVQVFFDEFFAVDGSIVGGR